MIYNGEEGPAHQTSKLHMPAHLIAFPGLSDSSGFLTESERGAQVNESRIEEEKAPLTDIAERHENSEETNLKFSGIDPETYATETWDQWARYCDAR